jgi:hypothetical protein
MGYYSDNVKSKKLVWFFLMISGGLLLLFSCKKGENRDETRTPYLEVDGQYLYVDDIKSVIPENASKADSLSIANEYIKKWVTEVLLYKHAQNNISNEEEIDKLVDDYKKQLVIHQYQQNLIQERLSEVLTDERLKRYYDDNHDKFLLTQTVIKGVYVQVPKGAPKFAYLENWMKSLNPKSLQNIEKYCVQNATSYQYFGDKWMVFDEISKDIPLHIESQSEFLNSHDFIMVSDSSYVYLLKVTAAKFKGEVEPYELAKGKIEALLMHSERMTFIKNFQDKLYKDAVDDHDITYYKPESVKKK